MNRPSKGYLQRYSTGMDQRDNGGTSLIHPNKADIVWRGVAVENTQ